MAKTRKDSNGYTLRTNEYQRDGRYMYSYYGWDRKRHFVYADSLYELRKKEVKINAQIDNRLDPVAADRITLNQLFDLYISQANHLSPQTRFNYKDMYDRHVRPAFGKMKITEIRYSDIKKFYDEFLNKEKVREGQKGEKRAKRTLENLHTPLTCAFEVAVKDGLLGRNPCQDTLRDIKKTREWKMDVKKKEALTEEQQNAFINYLKTHSEYEGWLPIMVVLFGTGLRVGECLSLTWSNLDWNEGLISVETTLSNRPVYGKEGAEKHAGMVKTLSSFRKIPIFPEVKAALQQEYEIQSIIGFCEEIIDGKSGFIFMNERGKVLSATSVNRFIKRVCVAYNEEEMEKARVENRNPLLLPDFSCHTIRHCFCTRGIEVGIPPHVMQKILGHSSIQTTIDIYTSVTGKQLKDYENYRLFDVDFSNGKMALSV